MAIRAYIPILIASALVAEAPAARGLDQRLIHGYYKDGEFDKVIKSLADYGTSCKCSREDSIFAEKHLAVVYAANPTTRELGRYHMFLMLNLAPAGDLLDMFVGEEVDAVFEKVRKEHTHRAVAQRPTAKKPGDLAVRRPASRPIPSRPAPRLGSESASPSGVPGSMGASAPSPAPNPYAKSARALLAGQALVPVRMASNHGVGVLPAVAPVSVRAAAPAGGQARTFPQSAFVPKPVAPALPAAAAAPTAARISNRTMAVTGTAPVPVAAASKPSQTASAFRSDSKPAWKEAGLWIGGGAALAVVAFTLYNSGDDKSAASKTYVVPASASN